MDLGLSGKVAIVAAASKGLGKGAAMALADEGVSLVLNARGSEALGELERELTDRQVPVVALAADVAEADVPARLVAAAIEHFGRLDIVVSNSGGPPRARALEVDDEAILAAIESNLLSHIRFVREALPHMSERGWGRICMIASAGILQPIPGIALSNVARTGLRAWVRTAASDLAPKGVTLNLLAPGRHLTDRILELPQTDEPAGDPRDFGDVVAFFCSEQAKFVNGATIVVDGGALSAL